MRTKTTDPEIIQARKELNAMGRIVTALALLNPRARTRVLLFVQDKLREELDPKQEETSDG